jgi:hypothetical protein
MNDLNPVSSICLMRMAPPPPRLSAGPAGSSDFYPWTSSVFQ